MSDDFMKQLRLLRADLILQGAAVAEIGRLSESRNERVLETLQRQRERIEQMGREMGADITELRRHHVESQAEWKQIAGRLKLTDSRVAAVLSATDYDRQELRALYDDLLERLREIEKRLGPPPAA